MRVVIIWSLLSSALQPQLQMWATYSIYYLFADQLVLRRLLIPQDNFKTSFSQSVLTIELSDWKTDGSGCSMLGRLHNIRKRNPQLANRSIVAQQLKSPLPSLVLEKLYFCTEEKGTVDFLLFYFCGWKPLYE